MSYDDNSIRLHRARAEHKCYRCDNVIKIGEMVAYQNEPYVPIGASRNEFCEVSYNECGQGLEHYKRGKKPIPRNQESLI